MWPAIWLGEIRKVSTAFAIAVCEYGNISIYEGKECGSQRNKKENYVQIGSYYVG